MTFICLQAIDITYDRLENIKGTGEIIAKLAIKRINRKTYALSGNVTLNPPMTLEPEKYYVKYYLLVFALRERRVRINNHDILFLQYFIDFNEHLSK